MEFLDDTKSGQFPRLERPIRTKVLWWATEVTRERKAKNLYWITVFHGEVRDVLNRQGLPDQQIRDPSTTPALRDEVVRNCDPEKALTGLMFRANPAAPF